MKQILITIVLATVLTFPLAVGEPESYATEQPESYATEEASFMAEEPAEVEEPEFTPWDIPLSDDLQFYIHDLCDSYDLSYAMVIAMIDVESSFNVEAVSHTNDYGLMQINAINHKDGYNYLNPYDNVKHGIKSLHRLSEKYEEANLVAMCWNCGEAGAKSLWEQGIYSTDYSNKVVTKKLEYERKNEGNY